ncbi:hypothetical protein FZEAL_4625 [Fusarium zealandicum]|uniref:Pathogenicity protein n=1 Tax=Fusarium zealandicum TaxID=1053134 RepID=A0A8H4UM40_9HYPO|nr:hypothetical protein FZEAL_4625 [Fusarium zealandicum]
MKLSTAALLALAHGIVAMPWSSEKVNAPGSKVLSMNEDVTLTIKLSPPAPEKIGNFSENDVCLKICWPTTPQCPEDWYSNNLGSDKYPCWTCCKSPSVDHQL